MSGTVGPEFVFRGLRCAHGCEVVRRTRDGNSTLLRCPLSWSGGAVASFDWGAAGPGAELLALAILGDTIGSSSLAVLWVEEYASEVVAHWPRSRFETTSDAVCCWLVAKTVQGLRQRGEPFVEELLRQKVFGSGCGPAEGDQGRGGASSVN